jgi:hypothetical protein
MRCEWGVDDTRSILREWAIAPRWPLIEGSSRPNLAQKC